KLHATLPARRERAGAAHQDRPFLLNESKADILRHRFGQLLAVEFIELRLGIEQVDLARAAFEIDANAVFGLSAEVPAAGREQATGEQHLRDGEQANATGAAGEEFSARVEEGVGHGRFSSLSLRPIRKTRRAGRVA